MSEKTAIIIGAGPAGLTAAYELLTKTDIKPIIFELTSDIGGISKTVEYKGNRIDIGGHRFFSKSDRVMEWWQNILPLQGAPAKDDRILKRDLATAFQALSSGRQGNPTGPDPEQTDRVMLVRHRLSRIFFLRKFFSYPVSLSGQTFANLGSIRVAKIGISYLKSRIFPIKAERSLEDFFINRFGKELYLTFFKDYTEKVWGVPCNQIKPEWGAQRIKGLSITKALLHALKSIVSKDSSLDQKKTETSLIEQFIYPKLGPGQMWETVAAQIQARGGEVHLRQQVVGIETDDGQISAVQVKDVQTGNTRRVVGDYFFSTMPVRDLIQALGTSVPQNVQTVAKGLQYRDFITVGLLLKELKIKNQTAIPTIGGLVPDTWIYIQERDVKIGRLQIFNNWSPYLVRDENTVWIGLEYFCNEGDQLWRMADEELAQFAIAELAKIDIITKESVLDSVVIRVPKTYPAYFGTYDRFDLIRQYVDQFPNLYLVGRNGMHRYNNADHSMLTAMVAVENIINGVTGKENIWQVNTEEEYHESK